MDNARIDFYKLTSLIYKDIDYPDLPIPVYAAFYVIMSQYFKKAKIVWGSERRNLRMCSFWISPSRTGKGQLTKLLKMVAEQLDISVIEETDITDAGLLGTIDEKAIDYNYKNKLKEDNPNYKNPVIYGDLFNYDIIIFKECKKLLIPTQHTQMFLSILQEALDEPGVVRKKLGNQYPIEGIVTSSIYATTYYMPEIEKTLVEQGFFMRVPIYCKTLSREQTEHLREDIIKMLSQKNSFCLEKEVKKFTDEIKKIENGEIEIYFTEEAIRMLIVFNQHFFQKIDVVVGSKLEILKSMSQMALDIIIKVASIHCCLEEKQKDKKLYINPLHMKPAIQFADACINTIIDKIEISDEIKETNKTKKVLMYYKEATKDIPEKMISKEKFAQFLSERISTSRITNLKLINKLVTENYFKKQKGEGNTQFLVLNER